MIFRCMKVIYLLANIMSNMYELCWSGYARMSLYLDGIFFNFKKKSSFSRNASYIIITVDEKNWKNLYYSGFFYEILCGWCGEARLTKREYTARAEGDHPHTVFFALSTWKPQLKSHFEVRKCENSIFDVALFFPCLKKSSFQLLFHFISLLFYFTV